MTVYVTDNNNTETFDDCEIKKVVRKGSSIDTFTANYSSKKLKKYKWTPDSKVTVEIKYNDANERKLFINLIRMPSPLWVTWHYYFKIARTSD